MVSKTKIQPSLTSVLAISGLFVVFVPFVFGQTTNTNLTTNTNSTDTNISTNTNSDTTQTTTPAPTDPNDPIAQINDQLAQKKQELATLQQQLTAAQQAADQASAQVKDVRSQVTAIDSQIAETSLAVAAKQNELDSLHLQMQSLQQVIDDKTAVMNDQKGKLAAALRQLDVNTRTTTLALVITHDSLADFYSQAQATAAISQSLEDSLGTLKQARQDLQSKQDQLASAQDQVKQAQAQLQVQQQSNQAQKDMKTQLLTSAQQSADQFAQLAQQSAQQEQQANNTINYLENQLRAKLSGTPADQNFSSNGIIWPIGSRTITALFHDPNYPYASIIGPHTGLDVATPVGTPVHAAADGIVSAAFSPDYATLPNGHKVSALNYVAIIHPGLQGISTRYLHLSKIFVQPDQVVKQGDTIGLSGGAWGAAGSGPYSSGPHLHFEVRMNGLPDDPLKYLPAS